MSRRSLVLLPCFAALGWTSHASGQESLEAQSAEPPERIDILVQEPGSEAAYTECEEDQDAATISGEIVVCRRRNGDTAGLYDREAAERRHAARTMGQMPLDVELKNDIPMVGAGITMRGCFIPPCPKPPVLLIDLDALPETPAGSDADRVGKGLAPRGDDAVDPGPRGAGSIDRQQDNAEELGLPPPLNEEDLDP